MRPFQESTSLGALRLCFPLPRTSLESFQVWAPLPPLGLGHSLVYYHASEIHLAMKVSRTHYFFLRTSIPPLNSYSKFSSLAPCLGTPGLVSFFNLLQWTFLYEAFRGHTCLGTSTVASA